MFNTTHNREKNQVVQSVPPGTGLRAHLYVKCVEN